jgi:hypothetical protein
MFHETEVQSVRTATTDRVRKHRDSLRELGLKPLQIWIPDTRSESFRQQCERESLLVASDPHEAEILDWIGKVADTDGWV